MFWKALVLTRLLRLRLDVLVGMFALWMFLGWVTADRPNPVLVCKVLGIAALVVTMYVLSFPKERDKQ
jgi:putative flippase GtrA